MGKFKEYLKEQTYDFKGMYSFGNGETSVKGSKIGIPPAITPKLGIKNLRVGVEAFEGWQNPVAIEACTNIMNYFGTPNVLTRSKAKWFKIAGFDKVCVKDEAIPNYTPKFHVECVYGTKNIVVPLDLYTPLAAVSQSFMFDSLKQQITARCSSIIGCAVMLGFAEDVMEGVVEPDMEEFMDRFENFDVPEWFERATGGVGAFLEFEDRKHQEALFRKEMLRTGGKYGRGYHWKIGRVPGDVEQDLNIKESINESKYTIYVDKNKKGQKTYVVYQGKKAIGSFLSDDPTLKKYMKQGEVKGGLSEATGPAYVVDVKIKKGTMSPLAWDMKRFGKPSKQGLAKMIKSYNDSMKPGGANEHLGKNSMIVWAGVRKNAPNEKPMAEWKGMSEAVVGRSRKGIQAKGGRSDAHVFASWEDGVLTWVAKGSKLRNARGSDPMKKKPTEKEVKKHLSKIFGKEFDLEFMSEAVKDNVDWKRLEDPDETEYLDDMLSKAKKMGDDEMIRRIMTMLKSKEKNITNEYP